MRVAVLGASGMLGTEVCRFLQEYGDTVLAYTRSQADFSILQMPRLDDAEAVINCAGVIPDRHKRTKNAEVLLVNSVMPHLLADKFKGPIIHISTDCVFGGSGDGEAIYHYVSDLPCPVDVYGRSKLSGEVRSSNVCNVRTSFVGFRHGLLYWILNNAFGPLPGYTRAYWSGSTVYVVAKALVALLHSEKRNSIEHLSTLVYITKAEVIKLISEAFKLEITVEELDHPYVNRALSPTLVMPDFKNSIEELVNEREKRYARV